MQPHLAAAPGSQDFAATGLDLPVRPPGAEDELNLTMLEEFDLAESFLCLFERFVRSAEIPAFA